MVAITPYTIVNIIAALFIISFSWNFCTPVDVIFTILHLTTNSSTSSNQFLFLSIISQSLGSRSSSYCGINLVHYKCTNRFSGSQNLDIGVVRNYLVVCIVSIGCRNTQVLISDIGIPCVNSFSGRSGVLC